MRLSLVVSAVLGFSMTGAAYACSDCEDKWCVLGACACVQNVGRCPPRIPEPERFQYCNIYDNGAGEKSDCFDCSSLFSGDAGKADCLARHAGHYVKGGACNQTECRTMKPANLFNPAKSTPTVEAFKKSSAPNLMNALRAETESLTTAVGDKRSGTATMLLEMRDGTKLRCSYEMTYSMSKNHLSPGLSFTPLSEECTPVTRVDSKSRRGGSAEPE